MSKGPISAKPLTSSFTATTAKSLRNARGSVPATVMIAKLEERGSALRERAILLHKKFEDRWVAKEAIRIWQGHLARTAKLPVPKDVDPSVMPQSVMRMASYNIQARTNRRLTKIDAITTRMGNSVIRNLAPANLKVQFNLAAPKEQPSRKLTVRR